MTTLERYRVAWTGTTVIGGGVSTFYTGAGQAAVFQPALKTFFTALKTICPTGTTWTVPTAGETIDDNTGEVNGTWSAGSGGGIFATNSTEYAMGVGARIVWETAGMTGGRRVRGSTYIVPLGSNQWENNGTLSAACLTSLFAAANTLRSSIPAEEMVVLTRLRSTTSGTSHGVLSAEVPDKVSWLRTRKT